jgi:DNA-binding IclR family transcriptional regulator
MCTICTHVFRFVVLILSKKFRAINGFIGSDVYYMHNEDVQQEHALKGTQSIQRAVALLRALARVNNDGGSAAELAHATAVDRTTAHRMLQCLAAEGLLRYSGKSHRYFLGPLAFEIGLAAAEQIKLRRLCEPTLKRIAAQTGDTVFLMERERHESVCIDRAEGHFPVKTLVVEVGDRRPLGIGAASLAILTAMTPDDAEAAIMENVDRISDFPGMSVQRLRRELAEARTKTWVGIETVGVIGAKAVAVPLCTVSGRPIGALSIAAIEPRMTQERQLELLAVLRREALLMTERLGDV